jgi:hypothetical protein
MRRFSQWFAMLAALICLAALPASAQKTTVDPNTIKSPKPEEDASDLRLAQLVTYEARRKSVLTILTDLSEKTGVALKAGKNNKDWQVRDLKMNVFAKDVPLSALMSSIARAMKFKWSRDGEEGEYSYRLYMDRKSIADAELKRQKEEQRLLDEQASKRQRLFAAFQGLANLKPEELEKLKQTDPFLYFAAKSGAGQSLGAFFEQVPVAVDALATGQEMSMNAGMLPPPAQQNLIRAMRDMHRIAGMLGDKAEFPEDVVNNPGAIDIRINAHLEEMRNRPEAGFMLGMMEIRGAGKHFGVPLMDPDSQMAKLIGKILVKSMDEGKPAEEAFRESQSEFMTAILADMKKVEFGEKPVEHPDEPALHEKIKIKPESRSLDDVLFALAEASKLNVVSDYFARRGLGAELGKIDGEQEAELKTVLDKIADAYRLNWEKHGDVLEFRNREWYHKRPLLIPEETLEAWRKAFRETGTLDIADLAQMAALDIERFSMNIMDDEVFSTGNIAGTIFPHRELLRMYASLDDAQRAMLFGEFGLDLRALTPEQWKQAEKLLSGRNPAFLQNADAHLTVAATRAPKGKQFEYTFTVTCTDQDKPIEWKFTTPEYKEPPKKEPKPAEPAGSDEPKTEPSKYKDERK